MKGIPYVINVTLPDEKVIYSKVILNTISYTERKIMYIELGALGVLIVWDWCESLQY